MWKRVAIYGACLAAGTLALQWFDYQSLARAHPGDIYIFLIAAAFLGLGVFIGQRLFAAPKAKPFDGNPPALAELGISPRELAVLRTDALARARELGLVP